MAERKSNGKLSFAELKAKVLSGGASLEETEEFQRQKDLGGLKSYLDYLHESAFTVKWTCEKCGTKDIPCSIDCPQCDNTRPAVNRDADIEGEEGEMRQKAHRVKKRRSPLS